MALSDIAAGIETTTEQRDRGVATVDDTGGALGERLAPFSDDLPCSPAAAATVVETYAGGASVGEAGHEAGVAPVTAAKALHRLGVEGVTPLSPQARAFLRDWFEGVLTRTEARELAGASETEFALGAYVETHDPIEGAWHVVEGVLSDGDDAAVRKREALGETMSDVGELL